MTPEIPLGLERLAAERAAVPGREVLGLHVAHHVVVLLRLARARRALERASGVGGDEVLHLVADGVVAAAQEVVAEEELAALAARVVGLVQEEAAADGGGFVRG